MAAHALHGFTMVRPKELLQADRTGVLVLEALPLQGPQHCGRVRSSRRPRPAKGDVRPNVMQPTPIAEVGPAHVNDYLLDCSSMAIQILCAPDVSLHRSEHNQQESDSELHLGCARGQCEVDARVLFLEGCERGRRPMQAPIQQPEEPVCPASDCKGLREPTPRLQGERPERRRCRRHRRTSGEGRGAGGGNLPFGFRPEHP
mmetsp:Transcript_169060/g.537166  ORF Transcript_169060/g.537166 Transcript_169060/m.537166 type:complete len:202 (+) Transcript_169060:279-884(+)